MTPNWRCIWGKITRSVGLRGVSDHDALFYTWGFTQPDPWGLLRRADAKATIFPYRSTEGRVQGAIDRLISANKICTQSHQKHEYIHWCQWDTNQPETVRWRNRSKLEPPFSFVCPNQCGPVRTSADQNGHETEKKGKEREKETKEITPLSPPSAGGAASNRRRRRRKSDPERIARQGEVEAERLRRAKEGYGGLGLSPEREEYLKRLGHSAEDTEGRAD